MAYDTSYGNIEHKRYEFYFQKVRSDYKEKIVSLCGKTNIKFPLSPYCKINYKKENKFWSNLTKNEFCEFQVHEHFKSNHASSFKCVI